VHELRGTLMKSYVQSGVIGVGVACLSLINCMKERVREYESRPC